MGARAHASIWLSGLVCGICLIAGPTQAQDNQDPWASGGSSQQEDTEPAPDSSPAPNTDDGADSSGEHSGYVVAVPMNERSEAIALRVGAAARTAVRGMSGVDWRQADRRFVGYDEEALSALNEATQHLSEGRQAYLNLELDQAIEHLTRAVSRFEAGAAALDDPADLAEALLFLGAARVFNDQTRMARLVFRRLHAQMPHVRPDPDTFPPEVVSLFERSTPSDASRPRGRIRVVAEPVGSFVYVDFLARGRAPLTVHRLIGGAHIVRVTRPGATPPYMQTVRIRRGGMESVDSFVPPDPNLTGLAENLVRVPEANIDELEEGNPIGALASGLGVQGMGVIRVQRVGRDQASLELLLFDATTGERLVHETATVATAPGELESAVQALVRSNFEEPMQRIGRGADSSGGRVDGGDHNGGGTDNGGGSSVADEWWLWTLIGLAVAGAAVAVGIFIASENSNNLGSDPGGQVLFTF